MLRLLFTVISVFAIFSDHYTALGGKGVDDPEYPPATNWVGSQGYEKFGSSVAVVPFWRGLGGNDDINGANEYVIGTSNSLTYESKVGDEVVIIDTGSRGYISVHTKNTDNGVYTEIPTYLYGTMNRTCAKELKEADPPLPCVGVPDDWEGNEAGFGSAVAISEQPSSKSLSRFMVAGNPTKAAQSVLIFSRDKENKWPTDKFYIMQVRQNSYAVKLGACEWDSEDVPDCQCSIDPVTSVPNCQVDIDKLYTKQTACLNDETNLIANCELCGDFNVASACISDAADCCNNPYKTCAATIDCTCLTDSDKGKVCTSDLNTDLAMFNIGDDNKWAGPYGDSSGPNKWDTSTSFNEEYKKCGSNYCKIGAEGERTYPGENDGFGNAISIFGDTLAISAMQYMGAQGAVYLYMTADVKSGSAAEFPPGSPGSDRDFAGNRAVVGNAGNKYNVFSKNYWPVPYMILEGDKQEEGDTKTEHFGQSVCVTTNYIAVGSPQAQGFKAQSGTDAQLVHAGRVFIFARENDKPNAGWKKENVKILTGTRNNGYFGYSVSMTENLSKNNFGTILVGEHQQKGIPVDGNGSGKTVFEGEVSIYNFETVKGKSPTMADKPDATYLGDTQEGDFGRAVALGATRFAVAGRTNKVWVYGTDELGNWSEDLVAVQTGEGTESEYGMVIATDGKTFVLSTAPTFLTTDPEGGDIVNAGKVYVYYIFEPSVLTVTMIMGILIFTISMLCFAGVFFRFYFAEAGDAKVIDPKLAAKAARLGFGHHNVGHKHVAHRHGEASKEKKFLAPAGKNVTKMSKAPASHGTSNPLQAGNEMVEEVYGSEL